MSAMLKVTPRVTRLINYLKEIEEGKLRIPSFQRDYVWGKKAKLELFESLQQGYPIGSVLFWKPKETFNVRDQIGPYRLPQSDSEDNNYYYILDGFQRLTTLFGCLLNPEKTMLEKNETELQKEFSIFYDLENEEFTLSRSIPTDITYIPVNTLIDTYSFLDYVERLRNTVNDPERSTILIDRARLLSSSILDYQLPSIEINGGTIEDAVDIFSRINSKGAKISTDWMVSALTYNEKRDFRLGSKIDELLLELEVFNFSRLKRELILQCIQNSFGKVYFDESITDLVKKENFIEVTEKTIHSIRKAVQFLFEELLVVEHKLLPYGIQLIFITYFFSEIEKPDQAKLEQLKRWFWITTYSGYFTLYSLSKQRLAFDQFREFVRGLNADPVYNDKPNISFTVPDFPKSINFGSVRAKALVLLLINHANDFKSIDYSEVNGLQLQYLFKEHTEPEAVVPSLRYVQEGDERNLPVNKLSDLFFTFADPSFSGIADRYLLGQIVEPDVKSVDPAEILYDRKRFIQLLEGGFATKLHLYYEV